MTITTSLVAPAETALVRAVVRPLATGSLDFLCYVTLQVSNAVTYASLPGSAVTVAPTISTAAPQQVFYAISDPTVTNVALAFRTEGPASVDGQTLTFAAAPDSRTLTPGQKYVFAFHETYLSTHASTRLYVANASNSVLVFDIAHGYSPLPPISSPELKDSGFVAIDANGKLFVSSNGNGMIPGGAHISVFDTLHGNAPLPPITFTTTGQAPPIAIDGRGRLYVANVEKGQSVSIFDTRYGNAPSPPLTSSELFNPVTLCVDADGKLYVANAGGFHSGGGTISVFDTLNGNKALHQIVGGIPGSASTVARSNGTLDAANFVSAGERDIYDTLHSNVALPDIKVLCGPMPSICGTIHLGNIALDTSGLLSAGISGSDTNGQPVNEILIFDTAHGNAQLPPIIGNGLNGPSNLAVF